MDPMAIVQDLTFQNYAHNRRISPHVTPERWERVYGPSRPSRWKRGSRRKRN